jgi:hypothetical protein
MNICNIGPGCPKKRDSSLLGFRGHCHERFDHDTEVQVAVAIHMYIIEILVLEDACCKKGIFSLSPTYFVL